MLTIYGIPACNTMKKAFDYLEQKGIPYTFHNYKKFGISPEILHTFIDALGIETIFNKQGSTFRQCTNEQKKHLLNEQEAFKFLIEKTSAIKRPIFVYQNKYLAGLNFDKLDILLNT